MRGLVVVLLAACGSHGGRSGDAATGDAFGIDTPANQWTWIEVPGTTCGDGTPAGFGINRAPTGSDLFVYFEGGGACWDQTTCFVTKTAVNIQVAYGAANLAADVAGLTIDRTTYPAIANASFVFVPYCTGDLHAGDNVMMYGLGTVHHTGGTNAQAFVDELHANFPDAAHVWVSGSSAGGYGATLNFHRFANAWTGSEVHLLQDSSPFIPWQANYGTLQAAWQLVFPPGCTDCATNFTSAWDAVVAAHPQSRMGLLTWDNDETIAAYFGYSGPLMAATMALVDGHYTAPLTKAFVMSGTSHTMLGQIATIVGPDGTKLSDWVGQWLTGDPAWATIKPAGD